jgi:hypothetical protein
MKDIHKISSNIARTAELLRRFDHPLWADRLEECSLALPQDTAYALSRLMSLYGGMGSINDVVLYENAKPLQDENNELQGLLSDLHQLCAGRH